MYRPSKFSEQLVSKNREIEHLHARIEGLMDEIKKLEGELKTLKSNQDIPKASGRGSNREENNHLLERIAELNNQEDTFRSTISQVNQKLVDSQNQIHYYQQQQKDLQNEIAELKEIIKNQKLGGLSEIHNTSAVSKENFDSGDGGILQGRDRALSDLQKQHVQRIQEIAVEKSELMVIIQEQKSELDSYENLLNDTKTRAEKDRQERRGELKKLIAQNQEYKTELYKLREEFENIQQELQLKTEELKLMKEHLDKRAAQNRALAEENRSLRAKADDFEMMGAPLGRTRGEFGNSPREGKEFESQLFSRNDDNKLLRQKLETTEFQLLNTMKSFKDLEQDKDEAKAENRRLLEKIDDLEREIMKMKLVRQEKIDTLGTETRESLQNTRKLQDNQEDRVKVIETVNEKLNAAMGSVKENFSALFQLVESSSGQTALLSKRIKEAMTRLSNYHYEATDEQVAINLAALVHEVALTLSQELDVFNFILTLF